MTNLLALALVACVVPALAVADVQVECPPNMVLSETGCRPRAKAAKKSPAATHERALELVVVDPKQALALFEEACTKKHGAACLNVGRFHATGRHWATLKIVKDPVKASEYFARGCERRNGRACYHHAVLATDVAEGRRRAERGCKLGDGVACAQVGIL